MSGAASWHRIYVRLPNWVGDVVLATPFLEALRRAVGEAEVVLHGPRRALRILEQERWWAQEVPFERRGRLLGPLREGRRLRREAGPFDGALLLPNSLSSALVAWATGAAERVGYDLNARGSLLTQRLPVQKVGRLRPIPMVDYYLRLLAGAGLPVADVPRRPRLSVTPEQQGRADAFLARQGVSPGARVWAINVGGAWETKRWIPEHGGELARILRSEGIVPLLLWGPGEEDLARRALRSAGGSVAGADEVVGLTDLPAVLGRCELLVSTDSGPRHFGVAAGIPVLVLIGSTHPTYTWVDYDAVSLLCEEVECWPCHLRRCPIDFRCMRLLTAGRVFRAGRELLRRLEADGRRPPPGEDEREAA